jgi:hypothetical protein
VQPRASQKRSRMSSEMMRTALCRYLPMVSRWTPGRLSNSRA